MPDGKYGHPISDMAGGAPKLRNLSFEQPIAWFRNSFRLEHRGLLNDKQVQSVDGCQRMILPQAMKGFAGQSVGEKMIAGLDESVTIICRLGPFPDDL